VPGLINLDFADVKTIMSNKGTALMGIGVASGEDRAVAAAKMAISSPLLETSIDGAQGVLMNITGGTNLSLFEVQEAADIVASATDDQLNMIFGSVINEKLNKEIMVTVIATGFNNEEEPSLKAAQSPLNEGIAQNRSQQVQVNQNQNQHQYQNQYQNHNQNQYQRETSGYAETGEYDQQQGLQEDSLDIPAFLRKRSRRR
jgi:cell division protein FtsZ